MTTAHRPTWKPATALSGGVAQGGYVTGGAVSKQSAVRNLPADMTLRVRQPGQGTADELQRRDLKAELLAKERAHFEKVRKERMARGGSVGVAAIEHAALSQLADKGRGGSGSGVAAPVSAGGGATAPSASVSAPSASAGKDDDDLAQFDDADDSDSSDSDSSDSDDDDDEDDTAALMRELEKIKQEREEERARKAKEEDELEKARTKAAVLAGNPLLAASTGRASASSAVIKRRWDDDVVFRNQARDEPKLKKRFINDTIRNDFHRRFLNKFIK